MKNLIARDMRKYFATVATMMLKLSQTSNFSLTYDKLERQNKKKDVKKKLAKLQFFLCQIEFSDNLSWLTYDLKWSTMKQKLTRCCSISRMISDLLFTTKEDANVHLKWFCLLIKHCRMSSTFSMLDRHKK
ncbi:CLUMA_CG019680, isoform A [Clunio marinus]|uniref:CLUMA_CG019680, isoform A n=1 Tax=Clunio marinus TaxID=568069 RepID=A0A1J1J379_9DIPT|nr:CLUMA_CG019680, isoform A [Clunio marinus]